MATIDGIQNNDEEKKSLALQKIQEALVGFSSTAKKEILTELQKRTSVEMKAEKKAQYKKLQPTGFKYAPKLVKGKREELIKTDNVEKMQWIHDNVSYNIDHTMNIIKLKKTFCNDVSGTGNRLCNWEEVKELAESKGYELATDYNDSDSQDIKENSDWYKMINIFSDGNGDTKQGMELFRDMAGCDDRYWTVTYYKDEEGKRKFVSGVVLHRILDKDNCGRGCYILGRHYMSVCGIKNMNIAA